ncbi:DUF1653 domain-containing protein [Butyrivibrio sp. FCS014]|uniref:DUF1653 domain-containing protein n=1 Tax=Butyrivibrio sp. FCS014 TaxID=1408304 RepID=UPI000463F1C1|nr:DUF1653 domain-containing protein [Butyrivibrio sp. FCS014]
MERPRPQEIYRHFKGNLYQIVTIAIHSETREEMVVYQALYPDFKTYVRPLDMFMSEVDRNKYPSARQKMRFEKVTDLEPAPAPEFKSTPAPEFKSEEPSSENESVRTGDVMSKSLDEEAKDLNLDPLVIQFMDADLAAEKLDILARLRPTITNDMIDIMALSVGVVVNEGDVYDRYVDLRNCLSAIEKFESKRLRD